MLYKYFFIFPLVAVSLITSCKPKETELPSLKAKVPLSGGTWVSYCSSQKAKVAQFDDSNFADGVIYFSDSGCTAISYVEERAGTYTTTSTSQDDLGSLSTQGNYDKIINEYAITPVTSAAATTMNTASRCGFTDWASGTTKVVTGLNCGSGILSAGTPEYDVYTYYLQDFNISIGGHQAGDLMFGYFDSGADGKTPATRPTTRNGTYTFRK